MDFLGRLSIQRRAHFEERPFLVLRVVLRLAGEHGKQPLDGGDVHLADRVERIRLQMLDVVQFGELAPIVRRDGTGRTP